MRDYVLSRLAVPSTQHVKEGTNLTTTKALLLSDGGFKLETSDDNVGYAIWQIKIAQTLPWSGV